MARMSFKVAPGVRVSASSRGIRTSIGNSKARVSVGSTGTYASAGAGGVRVSHWSPTGNGSRRTSTGGSTASRPTLAQLERAERAAAKEAAIEELQELETSLVSLHHEDFEPAAPYVIPPPIPADIEALRADFQKRELAKVPWYKFAERKQARFRAIDLACAEAERIDQQNQETFEDLSRRGAEIWEKLVAHDTGIVIETLEMAFADNASDATAIDVGVEDGVQYATVIITFGAIGSIPERTASVTPTGKPTTKKRTKTDRNNLYVAALGSTVLATVKEAFAVAPSVEEIRVVVLRKDLEAASPSEFVAPIYAARFLRHATEKLNWRTLNPTEALLTATDALFVRKGATGDVMPLDLSGRQDLAQLVEVFRPAMLNKDT
jgi:hypothetical protein